MNINEIIKSTMKDYVGTKDELTKKTLAVQKLIKTAFMEYLTNDSNFDNLFRLSDSDGNLIFPSHIEYIKDDKGVENDIRVFDDDINTRIEKLPENIQQQILEEMNRVRLKNIKVYRDAGRTELVEKEKFESDVISQFLPKEATEEEINEYLNQYYPNGIEKKSMSVVIKEVKSAFDRVNGGLVASCVKSKLV